MRMSLSWTVDNCLSHCHFQTSPQAQHNENMLPLTLFRLRGLIARWHHVVSVKKATFFFFPPLASFLSGSQGRRDVRKEGREYEVKDMQCAAGQNLCRLRLCSRGHSYLYLSRKKWLYYLALRVDLVCFDSILGFHGVCFPSFGFPPIPNLVNQLWSIFPWP